MNIVRLKKARDKSVRRRHPWIFSGAVETEPDPDSTWVEVKDSGGETLGFGLYNPKSQIRVRMWSFGHDRPEFNGLLIDHLKAARGRRAALLADTDAVRYVNSEGDFLPGILLDKYADTLVLQIQTEGVERHRDEIVEAIRSVFDEPVLFEKSVGRTEEELPDRVGMVYGGDVPPLVQIRDRDRLFSVDVAGGHKSGFYLDQRRTIHLLRDFFSAAPPAGHLLDCFCYSGAFGVSLRDRVERVTFVDSSADALNLCEKNWTANGGGGDAEFVLQDVFRYLREPTLGSFDAIILDPPSFAKRKGEVDGACRGYKDIQRLAMKATKPGGTIAVFCCSHHIDADLFQKVVFAAALDAARPAQILARFGPALDHPVSIDHPEGEYLKGLLLRIL